MKTTTGFPGVPPPPCRVRRQGDPFVDEDQLTRLAVTREDDYVLSPPHPFAVAVIRRRS